MTAKPTTYWAWARLSLRKGYLLLKLKARERVFGFRLYGKLIAVYFWCILFGQGARRRAAFFLIWETGVLRFSEGSHAAYILAGMMFNHTTLISSPP